MIYFFKSFIFFISSIFYKRKVDIVFYYPQHFNRDESSQNIYFNHLYKCCKEEKKSFLIFEEPDRFSKIGRNNKTIPFDFVYYLIIFFRKFIKSDLYIGKILCKTFFAKIYFNNVIILSQSMIEVFRGINFDSNIFDLQHGIIFSKQASYVENDNVSNHIKNNKIKILLFGHAFKSILEKSDSSKYYKTNSHVIGLNRDPSKLLHTRFNNNILVTLQFTDDHSFMQNKILLNELEKLILQYPNCNFYLRDHPRFSSDFDINFLLKLNNVFKSSGSLLEYFKLCSLHITAYSTTTFEAAYFGIPTFFLTSLNKDFNMFQNDFNYVLKNDIKNILNNYVQSSLKVQEWEALFYSPFNKDKFLSLLK
tara:strand:+ start:345 stop:1436 length:1092 start_codon:yes stop_codon:yes gene_type:complete